jgi:hypothetical protein
MLANEKIGKRVILIVIRMNLNVDLLECSKKGGRNHGLLFIQIYTLITITLVFTR